MDVFIIFLLFNDAFKIWQVGVGNLHSGLPWFEFIKVPTIVQVPHGEGGFAIFLLFLVS